MLFWGIFTAGYILGVIFTLSLFGQKAKVDSGNNHNNVIDTAYNRDIDMWDKFTQITQVNYIKDKSWSFFLQRWLKTLHRTEIAPS